MRYYVLCAVLFALVGCETERSIQAEHETGRGAMVGDYQTYVIDSSSSAPVEVMQETGYKSYTIRWADGGFDPDTLTINKGDTVGIYVTNMQDSGISTLSIENYKLEDFVSTGNTIYVEFKADHAGVFEFGDERTSTAKGKIIVI